MATSTPNQPSPPIEQAFVADRYAFWNRFTAFAKYGVIAVVVVLLLLWFFLG